jgi:hypothetical protein
LSISVAASAPPPVEYRVRFEPETTQLAVSVCVPQASAERRFFAGEDNAADFLLEPGRSGEGGIEREHGGLVAKHWQAGECLRYRADLKALIAQRRFRSGRGMGDDLMSAPSYWLWRPNGLDDAPAAEIAFELPEHWSLSAPWQPLDPPPHRHFRLGGSSPEWEAAVAIGHFQEREPAVGMGHLRLALLGDVGADGEAHITRHVLASANEVAGVFPRAFMAGPQVLAIPVGPSRDASPFGQSTRGGGYAVDGLVDPGKSDAEFANSWTFVHEFTHGLHPHLGGEGRWIAEGIATYYQNVLRARSGRLTADEAWDELDAGFDRGRKDKSELKLTDLSERMGELHHYMRGYWSGTALMLMADVELRTRDSHSSSLDAALNAYLACCRAQTFDAEPKDFLAELDRQVGGNVFVSLYDRLGEQSEFPDLSSAYRTLGLEHAPEHVRIDRDDADAVALRKAIMGRE